MLLYENNIAANHESYIIDDDIESQLCIFSSYYESNIFTKVFNLIIKIIN